MHYIANNKNNLDEYYENIVLFCYAKDLYVLRRTPKKKRIGVWPERKIGVEKSVLLENVNHETAARPFSIHRTFVGEDNGNALYLHCHPEAEFFYLEEGEISFFIEEQSYVLRAGDAMFVPPNLVHHADKAEGVACRYSALVFSLDWLSGYLGGEGNLYVNFLLDHRYETAQIYRREEEANAETLRRLSKFKEYAELPIQEYELRLLGELMIGAQEIFNAVSKEMRYNEKTDAARLGVQRGIDYVMSHYGEEVTLDALVESSGYSESHFCHRFKEVTGYTPFAYLNRVRVIKAAELLFTTRDKITQIAGSCGFDNISYFNRVFRKQMGMAPGEYRRAARTKDD